MYIKVEISVRRVKKERLENARVYAAFRVSQLPISTREMKGANE